MPICIAGDDAGLELASLLLERLGVDLGPRAEPRFARLNDELLRDGADQGDLRRRATELCEELALREPWGWADPRNSQTLSFWRELFPDLRVLLCVRDSREAPSDADCVVTGLERLRAEPEEELWRLVTALGLDSSRTSVSWAVAGPDTTPATAGIRTLEVEHLRLELARARGQIESLQTQVEVHAVEPDDLREVAANLEQQLLERDEELERLRRLLLEGDTWRRETEGVRQETERVQAEAIESLQAELAEIRSTRLYRTGLRYWALKARLRGRSR